MVGFGHCANMLAVEPLLRTIRKRARALGTAGVSLLDAQFSRRPMTGDGMLCKAALAVRGSTTRQGR